MIRGTQWAVFEPNDEPLWAQLQAQADAPDTYAAGASGAQPAAVTVAVAEGTRAPAGMYFVREIVAAAGEAGIAETHVRVALAEHEALGSEKSIAVEAMDEAQRDRLIGVGARSVRASRVIPEAAATVLQQLRLAAATAPWSLEFDTLIGDDPARGGVLRFSIPVIGTRHDGEKPIRALSGFVYHASRVGLFHVHVTVAPRGANALPGCELTITGDLRPGEQRSIAIYHALMKGLVGFLAVTGAIIGAKAGGAAGAVAGLGVGAAFALGYNRVGAAVGRWEHGRAHRVLTAELNALLRRVQRPTDEARAFGLETAVPVPQLLRGCDDVSLSRRAGLRLA